MPSVEFLNDSVNFEGNSDEETEKYNGDKLPSDFGADRWMKNYVRWTDERPMFSRCVVSAITASIGVLLARLTTTRTNSKVSAQGLRGHHQTEYNHIGILELIAFAVHGGLVAGPLSYYIDEYLERRRNHSSSSSKMSSSTYSLLIDQVAMAPPKLYLTFLVVDVTKTLLKTVLPNASRKSVSLLASALSDSLRFWPLSIYVLLKYLKKRRHYAAAINLCSIAFSMHLAKKRNIKN